MSHHSPHGHGWSCFLFCALFVVIAVPAAGDVISLPAQTVDFNSIDADPAFGDPGVEENSLVFYPTTFAVSSAGGAAPGLLDGRLAVTISAVTGTHIASISLSEWGIYTLTGTGTADTKAEVGLAWFVTILEVDGNPITPIPFNNNMTFAPKEDGKFNLADDPGSEIEWTGNALLDVAGALATAGVAGGATEVVLTLDNTLFAGSEAESEASIEKSGLRVDVVSIPEPSVVALLLLGMTVLAVRGSRRIR